MKQVIVVGGGITGLATAYHLQEEARAAGLPLTYTLLESDQALGGKIITQHVDGFVIEGGPDCFLSQKPWAAELCRRLGLGNELMGTNDAQRKVFVLDDGRLTPLPDGVMLIVPTRLTPFLTSPLISWPGKARMALDLLIPPRRDDGDESVADFVRRRLGQEALDKIAEPLMGGIHVSDPERQSLLGTFPRFRALELKHGSLIRGMLAQRRRQTAERRPLTPGEARSSAVGGPPSLFITLRGGLGQLVQGLERALTGGHVVTGARVVGLERRDGGGDRKGGDRKDRPYIVRTADGATFEAHAVALATPAYASAELVAGVTSSLADALASIRYVSTATITLAFRRSDVTHPLDGFGFVVPQREGRRLSACTWTSTKFHHRAPPGAVLLRCFVGGPGREELVELSDEELVALVREELTEIMGLHARPTLTWIFRWRKAHPQYEVGHLDRVHEMYALCERQPGLFVTGSTFEGVGVPDCIRQAQQTTSKVLSYLAQ